MKATIELDKNKLEEILKAWAATQGMTVHAVRFVVQQGDPGDPREAGYRRECIEIEGWLAPRGAGK